LRIALLASGSSGNALLVSSGSVTILVDAGVSASRVLAALGDGRLDAVLVTHEHTDHVSGLPALTRRLSVPVLATTGTHAAIAGRLAAASERVLVRPGREVELGDLSVVPFATSHDSAEPVGFTIADGRHRIAIATDLGIVGKSVRRHLSTADCVVLEFNHDEQMLVDGPYPWPLKQRIMSNVGHLSNGAAARELESFADAPVSAVVLAHLSRENNEPGLARDAASAALERVGRADVRVLVAGEDGLRDPLEIGGTKVVGRHREPEGATAGCSESR
jgi:phosphoribosyl 1,2-cyclic phosphodiesterase